MSVFFVPIVPDSCKTAVAAGLRGNNKMEQ